MKKTSGIYAAIPSLLLGVAFAVTLSSCKERPGAEKSQLADVASFNGSPPFDVSNPGPDMPVSGRSLFDYLVSNDSAEGFEIPYPFERLVEKIEKEGYYVLSNLIPRGRSLQRQANAPNFFKFPRIVITPIDLIPGSGFVNAPSDTSKLGMSLKGRLFIGFSEPAKQMEVISFNEKQGRFEFQLVKDYGADLKPKIVYARRSVCTVCHQGQAPIFPVNEWTETNGNQATVYFMKSAMNQAKYYHGLPVGVDERLASTPNANVIETIGTQFESNSALRGFAISRARAYEFDNIVRAAHRFSSAAEEWTFGCGISDFGNQCRAFLTCLALGLPNAIPPPEDVKKVIFNNIYGPTSRRYPGGLKVPRSEIQTLEEMFADFSELVQTLEQETETLNFFAANPSQTEQMKADLERFEVTGAFDPTVPRVSEPKEENLSFLRLRRFVKVVLRPIDRKRLAEANVDGAAITAALAKTNAEAKGAFEPGPFNRSRVIKALLAEAGDTKPLTICCEDTPEPSFPATTELSDTGDTQEPKLVEFMGYCSGCHDGEEPNPPNFLFGTDAERMAKIKALAPKIIKRLDWLSTPPPHNPMPPNNSALGKALHRPENDSKRQEMIFVAKQLLNSN